MPKIYNEQAIRRADRAFIRNFQNEVLSSCPKQLYEAFEKAVTHKDQPPIDISSFKTTDIIAAESALNKFFMRELAKNEKDRCQIFPYYLTFCNIKIKITPKPQPAHFGNALVEMVCGKNDLVSLDYATIKIQASGLQETGKAALFAETLLDFMQNKPEVISDIFQFNEKSKFFCHVKDEKFKLPKDKFILMPYICYLFCIKEISRRMDGNYFYDDIRNDNYGKKLPFLITQYRTLKLIAEGKINIEDVFDGDALLGIVTGKNITTFSKEGLKLTKDKMDRINEEYVNYLVDKKKNFIALLKKDIMFFNAKVDLGQISVQPEEQDQWSDDDEEGRPRKPNKFAECLF